MLCRGGIGLGVEVAVHVPYHQVTSRTFGLISSGNFHRAGAAETPQLPRSVG